MVASKKKDKNNRAPHPIDVYAGERLRARRLLLNMSQDELGNEAGVTFQQIQKYESGSNRMSVSRVYELANILRVPVEYFFDGYIEAKKFRKGMAGAGQTKFFGEDNGDLMNRRETIKLVRAYYGIEDAGLRKQVLSMTRALAKAAD